MGNVVNKRRDSHRQNTSFLFSYNNKRWFCLLH